jgi:Tfp pilus assembly protein PilF
MRNHWRRNSLIAIVFASATIAGGQAQEQSGKNTSALGTDYQEGKAYLDAGKYEDALRAFKKANSADKALTSSQTNELRAESHAIVWRRLAQPERRKEKIRGRSRITSDVAPRTPARAVGILQCRDRNRRSRIECETLVRR